jgi:hypothetical protein
MAYPILILQQVPHFSGARMIVRSREFTNRWFSSLAWQPINKKHLSYIPPKWGAKTTILLDHTNILTRKKIKKEYANKIQQGKITKEIKKGRKTSTTLVRSSGPTHTPL